MHRNGKIRRSIWERYGFHVGLVLLAVDYSVPTWCQVYREQLINYNQILTGNITDQVQTELARFLEEACLISSSEIYAESIVKLEGLLNDIKNGQMALNFEQIEVNKIVPPHKHSIIILLSFAFGGCLGCIIVLLKNAETKRRIFPL